MSSLIKRKRVKPIDFLTGWVSDSFEWKTPPKLDWPLRNEPFRMWTRNRSYGFDESLDYGILLDFTKKPSVIILLKISTGGKFRRLILLWIKGFWRPDKIVLLSNVIAYQPPVKMYIVESAAPSSQHPQIQKKEWKKEEKRKKKKGAPEGLR